MLKARESVFWPGISDELEAEDRESNSSGNLPSHFHHPFNSNLQVPEIPALPVDNPVPPALTSKATPSAAGNLPVSSTSEMIPSITSSDPVIPITLR